MIGSFWLPRDLVWYLESISKDMRSRLPLKVSHTRSINHPTLTRGQPVEPLYHRMLLSSMLWEMTITAYRLKDHQWVILKLPREVPGTNSTKFQQIMAMSREYYHLKVEPAKITHQSWVGRRELFQMFKWTTITTRFSWWWIRGPLPKG